MVFVVVGAVSVDAEVSVLEVQLQCVVIVMASGTIDGYGFLNVP